jgi:hypothetical protein
MCVCGAAQQPCGSGILDLSRTPVARISAETPQSRSYGALAAQWQQRDVAAHLLLAIRP